MLSYWMFTCLCAHTWYYTTGCFLAYAHVLYATLVRAYLPVGVRLTSLRPCRVFCCLVMFAVFQFLHVFAPNFAYIYIYLSLSLDYLYVYVYVYIYSYVYMLLYIYIYIHTWLWRRRSEGPLWKYLRPFVPTSNLEMKPARSQDRKKCLRCYKGCPKWASSATLHDFKPLQSMKFQSKVSKPWWAHSIFIPISKRT